jgi:serine/threonine protein kinase/tetratricopeptide (TPR) repeat protein
MDDIGTRLSVPRERTDGGRSSAERGSQATVPIKGKKVGKPRLPDLPGEGQVLFGFRLRHELGRGAFACVYLAEQQSLAGRPVVLKVSGIDGDEPQTLAQLQHTHIVPIYSVHEDARLGLRAVCMPYFGGAALSVVLKRLWETVALPRHGAQLVGALEDVSNPSTPGTKEGEQRAKEAEESGASPAFCPSSFILGTSGISEPVPLDKLRGMSYVRAAAWISARLAEALQHAHQRGVVHRDVKPSNVLLGADGQPMLLDFNVAKNLRREEAEARATVGGTIAYMAPEHLKAMSGQGPVADVDHRSDIYSLGIVLYEALTGCKPFAHTGSYSPVMSQVTIMAMERSQVVPSLRERRPDVPWGLESIFLKCMEPDRSKRYQQAEQLAEDLHRFLEDRPLKYAPELSRVERVRKWARRHPRLVSSASVALAASLLLLAGGTAYVGARHHLRTTQEELTAAQDRDVLRAFEEGTNKALCLVNTTTDVPDYLRQGAEVCQKTLALYGVLDQDNWQQGAQWQRLAPEDRLRVAEDTRELLQLLAWARVRARPGDPETLRQALELLSRAGVVEGLGSSRALLEDRAHYLEQLGDLEQAQAFRAEASQVRPAGARDHYQLATTYARAGQYARAVTELDEALRLNPRHYWSAVQRGICRQELGQYTLAAADFGLGIGLWPEFAWGYFNRGYVLEKSGNRAEALADYTAALERDPALVAAYVNRGMARLELRQYADALEDLEKAAELGRDDAPLHAGRGVALEGLKRHAEADRAFADGFARAKGATAETRVRLSWVYGFAVSRRLPARAKEAFEDVLRVQPQHPQALYGKAMLLVEDGREQEAIDCFTRALEGTPGFADARRYRAILLARAGRFAAALKDANDALEREPDSGPTLYAAACVAALMAEKSHDAVAAEQAAAQAVALLNHAFARGYGREQAAKDPDLKALRKNAAFVELLGGGTKIQTADLK